MFDQRVELPKAAKRFAHDGARKTGIARRKIDACQNVIQYGIERASLAQDIGQDCQGRHARGHSRSFGFHDHGPESGA